MLIHSSTEAVGLRFREVGVWILLIPVRLGQGPQFHCQKPEKTIRSRANCPRLGVQAAWIGGCFVGGGDGHFAHGFYGGSRQES
jgi:hypothetical protein